MVARIRMGQRYEFPEGGERIRMVRGDRIPLDYGVDGSFIDRRRWLDDETRRGSLPIIRTALAEGETATGLSLAALRRGAQRAAPRGDPRFRADALRLLGEIEEAAGDRVQALAVYDQALRLNPKVGGRQKSCLSPKGAWLLIE
jgi:tetratricopeptide (TPR) repeat protein